MTAEGPQIVRPRRPRIQPANVRDLPTVLDSAQAANVLRMSVERVRAYTGDGERRLSRLKYTNDYLYDVREVLRFLEIWTERSEDPERSEP